MKGIFSVLLLLITTAVFAQPVKVSIRPLPDYHFFGDNAELKHGVNCMVISGRKQFEKVFGNIKRADTPVFANEVMLVLVMPNTRRESKLTFERISMKAGKFIEVYCKFDMNIHPITYYYNPIVTCAIPRFLNISLINFYREKDMKLLESIEIKK